MKLTSKRTEEASEGRDKASDDGRDARRLPAADGHHQRRHEERDAHGHRAQPTCQQNVTKVTKCYRMSTKCYKSCPL